MFCDAVELPHLLGKPEGLRKDSPVQEPGVTPVSAGPPQSLEGTDTEGPDFQHLLQAAAFHPRAFVRPPQSPSAGPRMPSGEGGGGRRGAGAALAASASGTKIKAGMHSVKPKGEKKVNFPILLLEVVS